MDMQHINSRNLIGLLDRGECGNYLRGNYRFYSFDSGISMHGGRVTATQNLHCSRLTGGYVNFVVLLEGGLDFAINCTRYRIAAEGGKVVMVAVAEEILFSRYLHCGETTVKIALKGIENRLCRPTGGGLPAAVYGEPVRVWPLDAALAATARRCLAQRPDGVAENLQREADALQLLAGLWRDFLTRYPQEDAEEAAAPPESFVCALNRAFDNGANQVAELACALHISERTLQRRLRLAFGITASEWLRQKTMQYALYALTAEQKSIGETAFRCGYRHTSSFTQAFKQYFDCTPAQIRRNGYRG